VNYKQIASRITGISCPLFGVSWNPPRAEVEIAQRVITFLEDRRVLYHPYNMEVPDYCIRSVVEIRHFLTDTLHDLPGREGLAEQVRAIRAACRRFMDDIARCQIREAQDMFRGGPDVWIFTSALGQLRGTIGLHLGIIAAMHGLSVEDELESILPAQVAEDD